MFGSKGNTVALKVHFASCFGCNVCSSDEVQKILVVPALNSLAWAPADQCWIVAEDSTDNGVEVLRVIRLSATDFSITLLLSAKPVYILADTFLEVKAEEPEV